MEKRRPDKNVFSCVQGSPGQNRVRWLLMNGCDAVQLGCVNCAARTNLQGHTIVDRPKSIESDETDRGVHVTSVAACNGFA